MAKMRFGLAGIPIGSADTADGIRKTREMGFDAVELEFVRKVYLNEAAAENAGKAAERHGVSLSVHAPYFINLNAKENHKLVNSRNYIYNSCRIGALAGAKQIVVHAAYYLKDGPKKVMEKVASEIRELNERLKKEKIEAMISPETTGKGSQFGSLEELLELYTKVKGAWLTVDFSHLHARGNGCLKTEKDFAERLEMIEKTDKKLLHNMHMHVSGIEYTEKGERRHLLLDDSDFNYTALLRQLKEFGAGGTIICESPKTADEHDPGLLKKAWEGL